MGGSGGGGLSHSERNLLSEAAEKRLRELAANSTRVLFACESVDRKVMDSLLKGSRIFKGTRFSVVDGSSGVDAAGSQLNNSSVLIVFTNETDDAGFLNSVIDEALLRKVRGMHARGSADSIIPSKVTAYRWPSMNWPELEALFS
jgi:hypothetical protein